MVNDLEQSYDSIEDEHYRFEEYQMEMEEARDFTESIFEFAKKAMDETFQKHPEKCKRMINIIEKYDCNGQQWNNIETECLFFKLNEIYETLA